MVSDDDRLCGITVRPQSSRLKKPSLRPETPPIFNKIAHSLMRFMQSVAHNFAAPLAEITRQTENRLSAMSGIQGPVLFSTMPVSTFTWSQFHSSSVFDNNNTNNNNDSNDVRRTLPLRRRRRRKMAGDSKSKNGVNGMDFGNNRGPAFVGEVFTPFDAYSGVHISVREPIELPFGIRTPEWMKNIFSLVTKNDMDGVYRFFLDIGDAVDYMERINAPNGLVGASSLELAYKDFKQNPHLYQFIPNEKQIKEANKLLREKIGKRGGNRLKGVPVFAAQNLSAVIATTNGIRWYTPYFFNKENLDEILERSVDRHFKNLIQYRYIQRRREISDDEFPTDMIEEHFESFFEPSEVEELMEEIGQAGIPLTSIISKAAEIQLYDVADRLILGNRWIRKATRIQPKFPFMVDSFEERAAVAVSRAIELSIGITTDVNGELGTGSLEKNGANASSFGSEFEEMVKPGKSQLSTSPKNSENLGSVHKERSGKSDSRVSALGGGSSEQNLSGRIQLPQITMTIVPMTKAEMAKLDRELDKNKSKNQLDEDKDPLFVADIRNSCDFIFPRLDIGKRE